MQLHVMGHCAGRQRALRSFELMDKYFIVSEQELAP
jgi:hypothetical protein